MQANSTASSSLGNTRRLTMLAVLSAIAYTIMVVGRVPVVAFLKYDPKDVIVIFSGFLFGPLSAATVSVVVSLVEMFTVSETGLIGFFMNVLSSCAFACTAAFIYKRKQTMAGAIIGLLSGVVFMTGVMFLWNYLVAPFYYTSTSRQEVAAMLVPIFLPFNLLKGGLNSALTLLLYKPLVKALRRANLLPQRDEDTTAASGKMNVGVMIFSAFLLLTCILLVLVMQGVI